MAEEIPSIAEAIERFLKDVGRGHSPATRDTYQVGLNGFVQHLVQRLDISPTATPVTALQTDWAVSFLRYRADGAAAIPDSASASASDLGTGETNQTAAVEKASKATLATYAAALSRFYKWCGIERLLTLPTEEYERMQIRFKEIKGKERRTILNKVLPDTVVEALLAEVRKAKSAYEANAHRGEVDRVKQELIWLRDIALLEALKCTGARVSELTNLSRSDLDNTNRRARAVGKGNKERWLYFSAAAWEAIEKYLAARSKALNTAVASNDLKSDGVATSSPSRPARRSTGGRNYSSQPLFARHDRGAKLDSDKPPTSRAVQKLIIALVEKAEVDSNITPPINFAIGLLPAYFQRQAIWPPPRICWVMPVRPPLAFTLRLVSKPNRICIVRSSTKFF